MVYLYVIAILVLAGIEGRPLLRQKKWAELAVFLSLIIIGAAIIVMDSVTIEPFRVSTVVDLVFRPYTSLVKKFLTSF